MPAVARVFADPQKNIAGMARSNGRTLPKSLLFRPKG